jgi:hypothetical protein
MALDFTGSDNDHVDHGSAASLDDLTTWTKIFWLYLDTWDNFTQVFHKGRSGDEDKSWVLDNLITDGFSLIVRRAGVNDTLATGNTGLATGKWLYVAATYDSGSASGTHLTYFQGDLATIASQQAQGGTGTLGVADATQTLRVGGNNNSDSIDGKIAWFGHWNRVLTLGELKHQQFRPHVTSGCVVFTHYGYNGTGTQPDWSGNGNSGAVTTATYSAHVPLGLHFGFDDVKPNYIVTPPAGNAGIMTTNTGYWGATY